MKPEYLRDIDRMLAQRKRTEKNMEFLNSIEERGFRNLDEVEKYVSLLIEGAETFAVQGRESGNWIAYTGATEVKREAGHLLDLLKNHNYTREEENGMEIR